MNENHPAFTDTFTQQTGFRPQPHSTAQPQSRKHHQAWSLRNPKGNFFSSNLPLLCFLSHWTKPSHQVSPLATQPCLSGDPALRPPLGTVSQGWRATPASARHVGGSGPACRAPCVLNQGLQSLTTERWVVSGTFWCQASGVPGKVECRAPAGAWRAPPSHSGGSPARSGHGRPSDMGTACSDQA